MAHRDVRDVAPAAMAAGVARMVDGFSQLAALTLAPLRFVVYCAASANASTDTQEAGTAFPGTRESMMLRPGPSHSPAAYFSADYDGYTKSARP
ncbi:hypothetical protein PPMP20_05015 [Paraburkholderia phymatum]|nr:hypothetical protein [Paraburkholderia phymatum]